MLGYALGARAFGPALVGGLVASPLIGVVIGRVIQLRFQAAVGWRRWGWSVVSLYLGVVCFGGAVGVAEQLVRWRVAGGLSLERFVESIFGALWGVTVGGFWLFLVPLAFGTHWVIEWQVDGGG